MKTTDTEGAGTPDPVSMAGHGGTLARGLGVAVWRQIADRLREDIISAGWSTDTKLPTEAELAVRFGVNRHTVRRSLAVLANEGIVRSDQGRGTFVAERPLAYPIGARTRFTANVAAASRAGRGELVGAAMELAGPRLSERLAVALDTPLHRLEILNELDGRPFSLASAWYPAERFPNLPERFQESGSGTEAMRHYGVIDYLRSETRITAIMPDPEDAARLMIDPARPLLMTDSIDTDLDGRPICTLRTRFVADRIELVVAR